MLSVLTPLWGHKPETGRRLRSRVEAVLDYAKAKGMRSGENPARWRGHVAALATSDQPPLHGDVLYLALEDTHRRLQSRLTKYFGLHRETWPTRLALTTEWKRLDQGGLDAIKDWCKAVNKPTLIMIDTLKKVRAPKKQGQTDYDADYDACQGLQNLAGELDVAIIVAHHDRKMGADDVFDTAAQRQRARRQPSGGDVRA